MILASIFQDGAVLQRDMDIPVWGKCAAGEVVTSELDGISVKTKSSTNGEFILYFPAHDAGGPFELTVSTAGSGEKVILRDILIGEVWLASGQSNMEYKLYGEKRLLEVMNKNLESDTETICKAVKADVDSFVGQAPQFDDITMLCLRFNGEEGTE